MQRRVLLSDHRLPRILIMLTSACNEWHRVLFWYIIYKYVYIINIIREILATFLRIHTSCASYVILYIHINNVCFNAHIVTRVDQMALIHMHKSLRCARPSKVGIITTYVWLCLIINWILDMRYRMCNNSKYVDRSSVLFPSKCRTIAIKFEYP